jgi:phosphate transport system permease protein
MTLSTSFLLVVALGVVAYYAAHQRSMRFSTGKERSTHSRPGYHGWHSVLWTVIPAALLLSTWAVVGNGFLKDQLIAATPVAERPEPGIAATVFFTEIEDIASGRAEITEFTAANVASGVKVYQALRTQSNWIASGMAVLLALIGMGFSLLKVRADYRARTYVEQFVMGILVLASIVAVLTTLGIVASLIFESVLFFGKVPITEFLFGTNWSPQTAIRADQVGSSGAFGAVPLFTGTFLITIIAMTVAVPIGLLSAIYLTQYASARLRSILKPVLEILAGVPTVVYGFFAALTVAPAIRDFGQSIGLNVASESALAAGLVMGVMIIPFMSSLSDDAITAVPAAMKDGSLAMGATPSETIRKVLIPAALPGIVGGFLLAMSRAIGETMIVVMAAGLAANLTLNPLDSVTTVTAQIVALLTGDQEFDSPKTLSAFALGLVLFVVTLCLNIYALRVVKKYREAYE